MLLPALPRQPCQPAQPQSESLLSGVPVRADGYGPGRPFHLPVDASQDVRAEAFGREVLSRTPQSAILVAEGDRALFALWYFHFALQERPDLSIVSGELLHFDWYQENLRATYPSLIVPGPFPWPETLARANPSRAVCFIRYSVPVGIDCLPPLASP
jgi:hypothetical protein